MPDVVLPVLDEAEAIPWVLERMPAGYRPIVVDNGSCDGSAEVAAGLGATVVHEPRPGYGAACHAGLTAASSDVVCFMDCDATLDPGDLPRLADAVIGARSDLALCRRVAERGAWPAHARLANRAIAAAIGRRTGVLLTDIGPMRAGRREALLGLGISDRRSGYPLETVLRAAAAGWRLTEVPVPYLHRVGSSKVTGSVRGTVQAIADMRAAWR